MTFGGLGERGGWLNKDILVYDADGNLITAELYAGVRQPLTLLNTEEHYVEVVERYPDPSEEPIPYVLGLTTFKAPEPLQVATYPFNIEGEISIAGDVHFYTFTPTTSGSYDFRFSRGQSSVLDASLSIWEVGVQKFVGGAEVYGSMETASTGPLELTAGTTYSLSVESGLTFIITSLDTSSSQIPSNRFMGAYKIDIETLPTTE